MEFHSVSSTLPFKNSANISWLDVVSRIVPDRQINRGSFVGHFARPYPMSIFGDTTVTYDEDEGKTMNFHKRGITMNLPTSSTMNCVLMFLRPGLMSLIGIISAIVDFRGRLAFSHKLLIQQRVIGFTRYESIRHLNLIILS